MIPFEAAVRATQGARRYQEDMAAVWPGGDDPFPPVAGPGVDGELIAVLADGMGGHAGGALASRTVCEEFLKACVGGEGDGRRRLCDGLEAANAAIARKVATNPALSGMGSTLIGVAFGPDGVEWVSVGDSPLMLYRNGEIAHLNEDHSLAPELDRMAAAGRITVEEARRDPRRHMLRAAVTGEEIDLVDVSRKPLALEAGDYVILASDGIHALEDGELGRIVAAWGGDGPAAVAEALILATESVGDPHQDNATVIVVRSRPPSA